MIKRFLLIIFLISLCAGCDQKTKILAKEHLYPGQSISYFGDIFRLTLVENHGAFLELGSNLSDSTRFTIFTVLIAVGLVLALIWMAWAKKLSPITLSATVLLVSGGLGNLIDRITNNGGVIDFMNLGIGPLRTGIFNVADVYITIGFFILFIRTTRTKSNLQ